MKWVKVHAIDPPSMRTRNTIKRATGMEKPWNLNHIKSAIVKKYQTLMRSWILHTAMRIIDIIVMTYLHIEPVECHWPPIMLILKT